MAESSLVIPSAKARCLTMGTKATRSERDLRRDEGVLASAHLGEGFSTATTETWRASPLANVIPRAAQNGAPPRLANISRPEIVFEAEWRRDRVVRTYASRVPSEVTVRGSAPCHPRSPSPQIRPRQGLVDGKIAARATNEFLHGIRINELEAVAKCVPLTTYGLHRHRTAGKRKVQLYDLAQRHFNSQHGCDPGFADVHRISLQHTASAGIDCDVNLNLESGLTSGVGNCANRGHC